MSEIEWEIEKQARKFIPHNEPLGHTITLDDFHWPKVKKGTKLYLEGTQYKVTQTKPIILEMV